MTEIPPPVTGVHTIAVPVTDQDRAVSFYGEVLGLQTRMDAPVEQLGGRWIEMAAAGAETTIALVPTSAEHPAGGPTGIRLHTADAQALHRSLTAAGGQVGELLRWPGTPAMFVFDDPDGNTLVAVE